MRVCVCVGKRFNLFVSKVKWTVGTETVCLLVCVSIACFLCAPGIQGVVSVELKEMVLLMLSPGKVEVTSFTVCVRGGGGGVICECA